jgi:hypothetical protein
VNRGSKNFYEVSLRFPCLLILPTTALITTIHPILADEPLTVPNQAQPYPALKGQVVRQANAVDRERGIRSLPEGREPDYIIGKFGFYIGPFLVKEVNRPMANTVELTSFAVKKWQGKKVHPCILQLTALEDNSGGYYFQTITSNDGPRGWLMPVPKRPKDKVTPWAIYFDQ